MTQKEIEILAGYNDPSVSMKALDKEIRTDTLQDEAWVISFFEKALGSDDEIWLKAACSVYWCFEQKERLEQYFNQMIINPYHCQHQALVKHLQDDLKYPSAVPYIRKALESNFDYLEYTNSEDGVIAKWFSHALHAIGTKEAIDLIKEFASSPNRGIRDEMRYRLLRGRHADALEFDLPRLLIEPFASFQQKLPRQGKHFIGQLADGLITFYAAFNPVVADYAVRHQKFGGDFRFDRMTWIKPGFMWMMHRSGWATKENQERILAIQLKVSDVMEILKVGVESSLSGKPGEAEDTWKERLSASDVIIQWDPDHGLNGEKLNRKVIQTGIRGEMLQRYNDSFIQSIEDITSFVEAQNVYRQCRQDLLLVPCEMVVKFGDGLEMICPDEKRKTFFQWLKDKLK
jgi:hypothetical protein